MVENTSKIRELCDEGEKITPSKEAPLASNKPKLPRQLTCWKCQKVFMSTEEHFRFKDGRKLCPEHKATYLAWLADQKQLAAERERVLREQLDRPVAKRKSTQPTPVLLSGDLVGPTFGRR